MDLDAEFAQFVRANTPALLRTAYLLTGGDAVAAEELVQDTLVRLYQRWELVAGAGAPLAYVRRSLANQFINQTRRPWRREVSVETLPEHVGPDESTRHDDRDELWAMLRTLPDRQRAALVLRYFHDLPDPEIGAALGCRLGTVRSLISRGLAALRDQTAVGRPA